MVNTNPTSQTILEQANLLRDRGEFEQAINTYFGAIKLDLANYQAYHNLGQCLVQQNRLVEATGFFYHALGLNPKFAWSYFCLGRVLFWQNKLDESIKYLTQAIKYNSKIAVFYYQLGKALVQKEDVESAIKAYQQTINLDPAFYWAHCELGQLWHKKANKTAAIACYIRALEIDPYINKPYQLLEHLVLTAEQQELLINCYQTIVEKHPEVFLAWGNLGDILTKKGQIKLATKCYQTASYQKTITLQPDLAPLYLHQEKQQGPDYIIIGAGKCGTTSLHGYLSQHPQILPPHNKELNFFNKHFEHQVSWYLAHFPTLTDRPNFLTGEASPGYFHTRYADERLRQLFPQTKLILLLRNPIDRAISWYHHDVRRGKEKRTIETVIDAEIELIKDLPAARLAYKPGTLGEGLYVYKLQRWLALFPREQLLILTSEDFYAEPENTTKQVFDFLGLQHHPAINYKKYNQGSYKPIDNNLRLKLQEFYQVHNQKLEAYLGRNFAWDN